MVSSKCTYRGYCRQNNIAAKRSQCTTTSNTTSSRPTHFVCVASQLLLRFIMSREDDIRAPLHQRSILVDADEARGQPERAPSLMTADKDLRHFLELMSTTKRVIPAFWGWVGKIDSVGCARPSKQGRQSQPRCIWCHSCRRTVLLLDRDIHCRIVARAVRCLLRARPPRTNIGPR